MQKAAIEDAQPEGSLRSRNPVWVAMEKAQRRPDRWDEFVAAVEKHVPANKHALRSWINRNEDLVLSQVMLRAEHRSNVRGTASAEAVLAHIGRVMGRRIALFRNRRRLDIVLGLICAQVAHNADPVAYAGRIRGFAEGHGGWTGMTRATWPQWRDRWVGQSSIDTMLRDADLRAALEAHEEAREDKRRQAIRTTARIDSERAGAGLPSANGMARRPDKGRRARRPEPNGEWLGDYPEVLAQWHPTKNPGVDPFHDQGWQRQALLVALPGARGGHRVLPGPRPRMGCPRREPDARWERLSVLPAARDLPGQLHEGDAPRRGPGVAPDEER
jgi:hypothetical protein